ncbi:HU family DNA-binding protein [Undibacterium sp. FT79W]|jgi:hypothetical protein|nr:HU family DNA-binding protein [Undibacterium sp. FT79W]
MVVMGAENFQEFAIEFFTSRRLLQQGDLLLADLRQLSRAARSGFNPSKGTKIKIPAGKVPKFVPGAGFKAAVDPKAAKRKAAK